MYRYKTWSDFSFSSCGNTSVISAQWRVSWKYYRLGFSLGYIDSCRQALATETLAPLKIFATIYCISYNFSYNSNHDLKDFQILNYLEWLIPKGHSCCYLLVFHISQPCGKWDPHGSVWNLQSVRSFLRNAFPKCLLPSHHRAESICIEPFQGSACLMLLHIFTRETTKEFWTGHPFLHLQEMLSLFL